MGEIVTGVEALDFDTEKVNDTVKIDDSRAVKVSTLFVDKIASLYARKADKKEEVTEETTENPVVEEQPEVVEPSEPIIPEEPVFEAPAEPTVEVEPVVEEQPAEVPFEPIADPDGMFSDIASSFEIAVKQIHEKQAEVDRKEKELDELKEVVKEKEEKANALIEELEVMKKEVETSKKEADKIIAEAETQEKALQKRVDAFEKEREKFLNTLKTRSSSIMDLVGNKKES